MTSPPPPVALITGAAKRVGRGVALRLAREGWDVAFTYLNSEAEAKQLASEIVAMGRKSLAIRADLTDPEPAAGQIDSAFSSAFSQLDLLINNASLYYESGLRTVKLSDSRRLWAIHVESPTLLCRTFAARLAEADGSVLNMLDLLAEKPLPDYLVYCATKAAAWNLTLGLARELAPKVRVNGIAPGVVEWPKDLPESARQAYLHRVPLNRAGTPEDVAEAVLFLIRDRYMTGQILRLDGGRSLM